MTICRGWGWPRTSSRSRSGRALSSSQSRAALQFAVAQRAPFGEVALGVVDGTGEHVEVVVQSVEFVATNHDFVRAERQFSGSLPRHPVPLPAALAAELTGPSRARSGLQHATTPPTSLPWAARPSRRDSVMTKRARPPIGCGPRSRGRRRAATDSGASRSRWLRHARRRPHGGWRPIVCDNRPRDRPPPCPRPRLRQRQRCRRPPRRRRGRRRRQRRPCTRLRRPTTTPRSAQARFRDLFGADVVTRVCFNGTGANVAALATMMGSLRGPAPRDRLHRLVAHRRGRDRRPRTGARYEADRAPLTRREDHARDARERRRTSKASSITSSPASCRSPSPPSWARCTPPAEIAAVCDTAHRMGMLVHLDGARIANATAALGGDTAALRSFTIDAGVDVRELRRHEERCIRRRSRRLPRSRASPIGSEYVRKQVTQLPSKMRYLSAQFNALLRRRSVDRRSDNTPTRWRRISTNSSPTSPRVDLGAPPQVNSLFPRLPADWIEPLRDWCFFWDWDVTVASGALDDRLGHHRTDVERFAAGVRAIVAAAIENGLRKVADDN